ncbi:MAG: hypothetical protein WBB32_06600 [Flavobacteriales bacterium]
MKKMIIVLGFLIGGYGSALAQSTAFRYIIGETHKVYASPTFDNFCMGLGMDRSFNDRLTVGFDITYDIGHALKASPEYIYLTYGGRSGNYQVEPRLLSLNYHTEYAIGDDGGLHGYIGTYVGLRRITQKWTLSDSYYGGVPSPFAATKSVAKMLVPIGLRMGLRGATDGGFMDLYAAVGYQIGGGKPIVEETRYNSKEPYMETSSLAVSIGLAYGIGW